MRKHNEVNWDFLESIYIILTGLLVYIVYSLVMKWNEAKEEEEEADNLTFVKLFINESSFFYDQSFKQYYELKQLMVRKYGLSYWAEFLIDY